MGYKIAIDDELLIEVMEATGVRTKQEAVEKALQFQIDIRKRKDAETRSQEQKKA
jgi:Arc/MetJ family transcription regulator